MDRKIFVRAAQNADEVCFEGLDGFFCHISTVIMGWDELVCHVVVLNCFLEISRALIVENVVFGGDAGTF